MSLIPNRSEGRGKPGSHRKIRCQGKGTVLGEVREAEDGHLYFYPVKSASEIVEKGTANLRRQYRNAEDPELLEQLDREDGWMGEQHPDQEWLDNGGRLAEIFQFPKAITGPYAADTVLVPHWCCGNGGLDIGVTVQTASLLANLENKNRKGTIVLEKVL